MLLRLLRMKSQMTPLSWDQDHPSLVPSQSWSPEISILKKPKAWVQVMPLLSDSQVTSGTLSTHQFHKYPQGRPYGPLPVRSSCP